MLVVSCMVLGKERKNEENVLFLEEVFFAN